MKEKKVLRVDQVWGYVKNQFLLAGLEQDLIHGVRHISCVRDVAKKLIKLCKLKEELQVALILAVYFHDLGRTSKQEGDHATISADIMEEFEISDASREVWEAAKLAVRFHSQGLRGLEIKTAETFQQKVLGLLVLCDHADACFPEGMSRALLHLKKRKKPILSKNFSAALILRMMSEGFPFDKMSEVKSDSLVAHCAYNCWAAEDHIIPAVSHLLSKPFSMFYAQSLFMFKSMIETLISLQAEKESQKS